MGLTEAISSLFTSSDEQAMWRVQTQDDVHAFAYLVRRWEGPIRRLCARMTGDTHRGEDLTQEAFAKVFARRKEYKPSGRFSTFLWRVAVNLCYDELRRVRRRQEFPIDHETEGEPSDTIASSDPGPDVLLVQRERNELVKLALLQLSETYRSVVVLRHYENLKFREIAEVLEIPEGTVKSRMAEALAQLNEILSRSFDDQKPKLCKTEKKRIEETLIL